MLQRTRREGLFCALIVVASILATWPFAEMGFQDDWSYIRTALEFARTGHFVYNGWSTAMLGWMAPWGALFIKLFGFSFTTVRLSMIPIAGATAYLFHDCLVRCGVSGRDAVLGTLTLCLSPVFTPMAASFMTDVPGVLVIVLCLNLCLRSLRARREREVIFWLACAALSSVVGGTVRQIAWLGALVMVPSVAWILHRRRNVRSAGIVLWIVSVIAVAGLLQWWNRQPYSVPEKIDRGVVDSAMVHHFGGKIAKGVLCFALLVYPVLAAWLAQIKKLSRRALLRIGIAVVIANTLLMKMDGGMRDLWVLPWIGHLLYAVIYGRGEFPGPGPIPLSLNSRMLISLVVFATALVFTESLLARRGVRSEHVEEHGAMRSREILWLFGPFCVAYFALLLPRTLYEFLYDRYFMGLMPFGIIVMLRLHRRWFSTKVSWIAFAVLALFSIESIGGTHDWFAVNRARVLAVKEVHAAGVPMSYIQGGFEYDGWTQIDIVGHVNEKRIAVPVGARVFVRREPLPHSCEHFFSLFESGIDPEYVVVGSPMKCFAPTDFPPIRYRAWLPPFNREIFVQKMREEPMPAGRLK